VDVNGGYSREQAADLVPQLCEYDLELIEQPLAKGDIEGTRDLRKRIRTPIYFDESFQSSLDLPLLSLSGDGVVVKLMKLGGIQGAIAAMTAARELGLKIMLSCMIESSLAVTAAAHLTSLADHVDLDAPLLLAFDPFCGVTYNQGDLTLPSGPGLGVTTRVR
jgi:L-alanine-DL-glutamate epimerase-like enolase superfamily enzyme